MLSRDVLITDLDTTGFTEIELVDPTKVSPVPNNSYNYKKFVTVTSNSPSPVQKSVGPVGKPVKVTNKITEGYATVEFRVKWYGHRKLYVKQVDVYDEEIGNVLKNNLPLVQTNIINNYLNNTSNNFSRYTNISNWYGFDEPATIDSYKPYHIVDSIVKSTTANNNDKKPLITTFCPYYQTEAQYQGSRTFPRWVREAKPEVLLFDFYPINWRVLHSGNEWEVYLQFNVLRGLLESANNYIDPSGVTKKFYYVGQASSYSGADPTNDLRLPTEHEYRVPAMLALAYGAKGLLFYNYYSDGTNQGFDTSYALRSAFAGMAARLKGTLGNKLLSLTYMKQNIKVHKNTYTDEGEVPDNSNSYSPVSLSITDDAVRRSFHAGIFTDVAESNSRYLFLVNLLPFAGNENLTLNFNSAASSSLFGSSCQNISLLDVESTNILSLGNGSPLTIQMANSEGKLYKAAPTVKAGGRLVVNETISTETTINAPMKIAAGCSLSVNKPYNINSVDSVEQGGVIALSGGGKIFLGSGSNIVFMGSAGTAAEWQQSLIITRKGGHPNLVWHPYAIGNFVTNRYRIWRKYESVDFLLIDSVNGATYKFMDTTIGTYEGELSSIPAEYKIIAVANNWQTSAFSNSVSLAIHQLDKAASSKQPGDTLKSIPIEFSSKNFPNPFNPATTISYSIPAQSHVTIEIYNVLSQKIAELENGVKQPGEHKSVFNAANLPSGIYFYNLTAKPTDGSKEFRKVNKMLLIK